MFVVANPKDINYGQETWFFQNCLFGGAPYNLGFDPKRFLNQKIIYLELNLIN